MRSAICRVSECNGRKLLSYYQYQRHQGHQIKVVGRVQAFQENPAAQVRRRLPPRQHTLTIDIRGRLSQRPISQPLALAPSSAYPHHHNQLTHLRVRLSPWPRIRPLAAAAAAVAAAAACTTRGTSASNARHVNFLPRFPHDRANIEHGIPHQRLYHASGHLHPVILSAVTSPMHFQARLLFQCSLFKLCLRHRNKSLIC
jgi:hypothetical protein